MSTVDELRVALDQETKRLLIDAIYSGRGHLVAAARWSWWNGILGLPVGVLGALSASGAGFSAIERRRPSDYGAE